MDCRDREKMDGQWYKSFDERRMVVTVAYTLYADGSFSSEEDDGECEAEFPVKFEVCGLCNGKGSHVNPSIDAHGISQEEFDEDPDFEEAYFEGRYDVVCYRCGGKRVEPVVNEDALTKEQKELWEKIQEGQAAEAHDRWCDYQTQRAESGYCD
jgi:hypothetical protein